ncbi:MAG: Sjogren's syndrome/scleroderma autoantigen 1 family protein [Haloquadratum sp.]
MSDFDPEAERKRLREKYEKDEERRKETQQMSELLLKGATMTNQHCGECGSPIFRYDGQEFCPTCQQADVEEGAENTGTTATTTDDDGSTVSPASTAREPVDTSAAGTPASTEGTNDEAARDALLRALRRHAELAEATDDPRRAKEHLSAAREAATALDTFDG